jgi:hypothetical protein
MFIEERPTARHHTTLADAIIAIETKLGAGASIDASKIADGTVSNAEFQRLNGVSADIQTQLDGKASSVHTHAIADVTGLQAALDDKSDLGHIHLLADITNAGSAAARNVGLSIGNLVEVSSGGKIDSSLLPAIAITDTFPVSSQAAMLALTAETGDIAVRTDLNKSFILAGSNPATLGDWQELLTPTDAVLSVFGRPGAVTAQAGDYSFSQISGSIAAGQIPSSVITYAKIQNVAAARLLGNSSGSAAAPVEIALAGSLVFSSNNLQLAGDDPAPGNSRYYGTDASGAKGYFDLPSGGGGSGTVNAGTGGQIPYYDGDGNTLSGLPGSLIDPTGEPQIRLTAFIDAFTHSLVQLREPSSTGQPRVGGFATYQTFNYADSSFFYALGYKHDSAQIGGQPLGWANYPHSDGGLLFDAYTDDVNYYGSIYFYHGAFEGYSGGGALYLHPFGVSFFSNSATYYGAVFERSSDHFALGVTGAAHIDSGNIPALTWGDFGVIVKVPTSLVADADLAEGEGHIAVDEGSDLLKIKVKYSTGTVKTFSGPLV